MSASTLLSELLAKDIELSIEGDALRVDAPRGALNLADHHRIKGNKPALIKLLEVWPEECLEQERRFGQRHARLFPLLEQRVRSPRGVGRLLQVFKRDAVLLPDCANGLTERVPWHTVMPEPRRTMSREPAPVEQDPSSPMHLVPITRAENG